MAPSRRSRRSGPNTHSLVALRGGALPVFVIRREKECAEKGGGECRATCATHADSTPAYQLYNMSPFAMKRRPFALALALTLLLTCCQKPAAPSPAASPDAWRGISSVAGRFSVELPGEPQEKTEQADTPTGKLGIHTWKVRTPAALLSVLWTEHPGPVTQTPAQTSKLLQACKQAAMAEVRSKLVSESALPPLVAGGDPGMEIIHQSTDGRIRGRHRMWFVGGKLYQVLAVSEGGRPEPGEIARFLDSFKVEGL